MLEYKGYAESFIVFDGVEFYLNRYVSENSCVSISEDNRITYFTPTGTLETFVHEFRCTFPEYGKLVRVGLSPELYASFFPLDTRVDAMEIPW